MTAAAAPFPATDQGQKVHNVTVFSARAEYVPPWYVPHKNLGTLVTQDGQPVGSGFTVGEMLPERRWAVQENGELLGQLQFGELYAKKLEQWFLYASPEALEGKGRRAPSSFVTNREHVPSVRDYVSMKIDPRDPRKIIEMGYDPDATKGTRPKRLWDSTKERFIEGAERMAVLSEQYNREQAGEPRKLTPFEREEVEAYKAGNSSFGAVPLNATQAKIEALTDLLRDGVITKEQYGDRVAAIFGGTKKVHPSVAKRGMRVMPCGEEVVNNMQRQHVDHCAVCTPADL